MDNINTMLQLCRLCLVKDNVNIPIFEEQGDISQIFQKISSCLPVKVSREDKLPQKICDGCSYKLEVVYDFRNTTVNAEKQLLTWLGEAQGATAAVTATTPTNQADVGDSQQIKPAETFVKQEAIDPSDLSKEELDVKNHDLNDKFEELPAENKSTENEDEPPPPKRAKRTAAVKAAIAIDDHESDEDDDDSGEPLTKVEDESDDGSDEDHTFVDMPSTSADDQPGPSGVGKDGGEAPITIACNDPGEFQYHYIIRVDSSSKSGMVRASDALTHAAALMRQKALQKKDKTNPREMRVELASKHKRYSCKTCGKVCSSREFFRTHMRLHEERNEIKCNFRCTSCSKTFRNSKNLNSHVSSHHTKIQAVCDNCGETVSSEESIMEHLKAHRGSKPPKCRNCRLTFTMKRNHTIPIPFRCNICGRGFAEILLLKIHVANHKDGRVRYRCEFCAHWYTSRAQLLSHQQGSHVREY